MNKGRLGFAIVVVVLLLSTLYLLRDTVIAPSHLAFEEVSSNPVTLRVDFVDSALLNTHHKVRREGTSMYVTVYGNLFSLDSSSGQFHLDNPEDVTHVFVEDRKIHSEKLIWEKN
ncbi:hypothetical protein ACFO0S_14540 [Chryseomicrobium palamuruense]|uniref:Uncharacterized protein n=1 Tax=Chryseomicrobium palamuruense TaxID=682973 RepID=A0ABV8UZV4_9BACL